MVCQRFFHLNNASVQRYCKFLLCHSPNKFLALFIILSVQCIISCLVDACKGSMRVVSFADEVWIIFNDQKLMPSCLFLKKLIRWIMCSLGINFKNAKFWYIYIHIAESSDGSFINESSSEGSTHQTSCFMRENLFRAVPHFTFPTSTVNLRDFFIKKIF